VVSFNSSNKFPTLESAQYSSNLHDNNDYIYFSLAAFSKDQKIGAGIPTEDHFPAYIGVYTADPYSVYSIVVTEKSDFNPIRLEKDSIITNRLYSESKYFYTIAYSGERKPLKIDISPASGSVKVNVSIITDLQESKSKWKSMLETPDITLPAHLGIESVVLDPDTSEKYAQKCKSGCIVLVEVAPAYSNSQNSQKITIQLS